MARVLPLALVLLLPALAGCLGLGGEPWPAPEFALVDTDGVPRNLTDYAGRVLIVDLMATWCQPCKAEMPHLRKIRESYPEDAVALLSVGTDPSETDADLEAFREVHAGSWPFARDTDDVARKLGLSILPKLVIVDPEGTVVFENQGETYPAAMARVINAYVEAPG